MISERKAFMRVLGAVLLVSGLVVFLNSFSGITGFAVVEKTPEGVGASIIGLAFTILGVLLIMMSLRDRASGLIKIIKTRRFEKSIKGHDIGAIDAAISKIGSGLGKEKRLTTGDYSIRSSKGGRVIFHYGPDHTTAELRRYVSDHAYEREYREA